MKILVLINTPEKVKGYASRYLLEISPSVFIGHINARVAEKLWDYVITNLGHNGTATLVSTNNNAQGYDIKTRSASQRRQIVDVDGIQMVMSLAQNTSNEGNASKSGWSKASRYRRR